MLNPELDSELLATLVLRMLMDAHPDLIAEAISDQPNDDRVTEHLRGWNQSMRDTLAQRVDKSADRRGRRKAPAPGEQNGRKRKPFNSGTIAEVRRIFERGY